jgi:hypothetical protein
MARSRKCFVQKRGRERNSLRGGAVTMTLLRVAFE